MTPTIENAAEATLWIVERGGCQGVFHAMSEEDVVRIMQHPATMIASDGEVPIFGRASPHPRSYGTFARGLGDRGLVRPGMKADLAIFDPARVRDMAIFEKPHQYAEGFSHVVVNGVVIYENGGMTAARPGRVLYGPSHH